MVAAVGAVAHVFLRPYHLAFTIDEGRRGGAAKPGLVFRFELVAEIERLIAGWKRDVELSGDSARSDRCWPSSEPGSAAEGAVGDAAEARSGLREHPATRVMVQSRSVRCRDMRSPCAKTDQLARAYQLGSPIIGQFQGLDFAARAHQRRRSWMSNSDNRVTPVKISPYPSFLTKTASPRRVESSTLQSR